MGSLQIDDQSSNPPSPSPIHHLPPEILSQIFELVSVPGLASESSNHLLALCLVCRAWRGAALAHPPLWSSLYVKARFTARVYDKVQAWFRRAGTLPKSLAIRASYHEGCWVDFDYLERDLYTFNESATMGELCEFAASYLVKQLVRGTRLDHLSLYCPSSACLAWITKRLNLYNASSAGALTSWDTLRSLRLAIKSEWDTEREDSETQQAINEMLRTLPPVTSLHIHLPEFKHHIHPNNPGSDPHKIKLPNSSLARLTRLTFDCDWHYRTVLDTIRPCLNLSVLTLHLKTSTLGYNPASNSPSPFSPDPVKDIQLQQLKVLRLRQANPVALRILRHFDTPLLAELDVSFEFAGFSWDTASAPRDCRWQDHIIPYITKSNCQTTVRRLRLHGVTTSGSILQELISTCFPWITDLTLDCSRIQGQSTALDLEHLTTSEGFSDNVPQLRTINLIRSIPSFHRDSPLSKRDAPPESRIPFAGSGGPRSTTPNPRIITIGRGEIDPPQLEDYDTDPSSDPEDEFDSWDFNLGVRGSSLHTLEHDYL